MRNRKLIAATAMTATLLGGAAIGVAVGNPLASSAQDGSTAATTTTTAASSGGSASTDKDRRGPGGERGGFGFGAGEWLEPAAKALGMSTDDLRKELADGKTLSDVAKEKGVDRQVLADALVKAGTDRLDELEAKLPDLVDKALDAKLPLRGEGGGFGRGGAVGFDLDAAAKVLGITLDDVRTALRDGTSLADLAKEKGIDQQKVIDALVAGVKSSLDQAVKDGKVTQEQADARLKAATERITTIVTEGFGKGGPGWGGGHGRGGGGDKPEGDAPADDGGN